jgi:hypothetical protein
LDRFGFSIIGLLVFHWEIEFKRDNLLNIGLGFGGFSLDGFSFGPAAFC